MSTFYTACAKCGDEIGSGHKILWLAARPFHPECATERDRSKEREAAIADLLEALKDVTASFGRCMELNKSAPKEIISIRLQKAHQAIANYVRLRDE